MSAPMPSSTPARTAITSSITKPRTNVNKKKRMVRRRGRAPGDIASDDEIEREAATDSGSENDLSSRPSDSDSDSEPEEAVPDGRSRPTTPNTSQSPGERAVRNKPADQPESFFAATGDWSEMVADDEKATESGDLPVIEFAEFDAQNLPTRPRQKKSKKHAKASRSAPEISSPALQVNGDRPSSDVEGSGDHHIASSSRVRPVDENNRRLPAHVARQAYQQRLESDPSYVPTVGGFWSHDDRLLDKELRSLSGWWRDRRGGRGRGNGFRGRGRGGFAGQNGAEEPAEDLPPIEKTWGHDGFEEMKQREEQRKASQQKSQQPPSPFQGASRGRGFVPGRGGRGGFGRGGYANTSGRSSVNSGRVWYTQKPEVSWTKQHDGFLYFELDPAMRPKQGQGQGVVVRIPGNKEAKVVRISSKARPTTKPRTPNEEEAKIYTVNLPERSAKVGESSSTQETPIEDVFKVRPSLAPKAQIPLMQPAPPMEAVVTLTPLSTEPSRELPPHVPDNASSSRSGPEAYVRSQLEQLSVGVNASDPERVAKTEEAVMRNPPLESQAEGRPAAVVEEPVTTVPNMFSPSMQPSPTYASPYGYAPLPPGIAVNQHGVPYELATGRPVYLQAPPPPMYNPRPMMHSPLPPAFGHMPSHSHSHSLSAVSPDFLAHSSSHTPPMNGFIDPSTGNPIFSFPRQTSRVEIRAPTDASEAKSLNKIPAQSSGLRLSAAAFEPSRPSSNTSTNGYYPPMASPEGSTLPSYAPVEGTESGAMEMQHDPAMMAYAPYPQQPYYYHDAYGYAHNPYLDMQHAQAYEMYPPPEGTVYY
ncbi:hypothetical protein H0H92_000353 [Tricholoma furcatifolium]|nr:hypothetical protein H0H92_000353 [Tricholoma furcatifolium]